MKTTRKRYSADFKAKVALEAIQGDLTLAELAAKHGVHHTMIASWKRQAIVQLSTQRRPAWYIVLLNSDWIFSPAGHAQRMEARNENLDGNYWRLANYGRSGRNLLLRCCAADCCLALPDGPFPMFRQGH